MGKEHSKIQHIIETLFLSALEYLLKDNSSELSSKLLVQVDSESGEIQVFDEKERLLKKKIIYDWVGMDRKGDSFYQSALQLIKEALKVVSKRDVFESSLLVKPFEFLLVGDDFKTIEQLYMVDDVYEVEGDLMRGLDADLDDFLKKLLQDEE